jgi:NDP-sugar pyrophosphorylase family protein
VPHLRSDKFLLASGTAWLADEPEVLLEQHRASGNAMTVFCSRQRGDSQERPRRLIPTGVYCCERETLKYIRPAGYQDLKEQWVPALQNAGLRVGTVMVSSASGEIRTWANYLRVLSESINSADMSDRRAQMVAPGVWIGRGSKIAPSARIVGPVVLGQGCEIESDTLLLGPVVLGDGCRVGAGSRLVRVVAPGRVVFSADASVSDRLVPPWDARAGARLLAQVGRGSKRTLRFGPAAISDSKTKVS